MSEGKPCCPNCREAEKHEALNVISFKFYDLSKVTVSLLICKECGTVFDPRYVRSREV